MCRNPVECCLGLGANLGDRQKNITDAFTRIGDIDGVKLLRCSQLYETAPVGGPEGQPNFLNGACVIKTTLDAKALLEQLQNIETILGRGRSTEVRWGPRPIDIDILLYGDCVSEDSDLLIPHPRMHQRFFVLKPLVEIAADAVHPLLQKSVAELFEDVSG